MAARAVNETDLPLTFANVMPLTAHNGLPSGAPDWIREVDHPYLHGVFAPVATEYSAESLEVESGEIPQGLNGMYVVNGPGQRFKPQTKYHFYDGDGMLNATRFRDGKASYVSRWIRTFEFCEEEKAGRNVWPGLCGPFNRELPHSPIKDSSNTDVIFYRGKLLTLWYLAGTPYIIDPFSLETLGSENLNGSLKHGLSAHSKVDPHTGELLFFNYQDKEPYMSYGVADKSGNLLFDIPIDIPGPRSPHDLGITPGYSILHDLPYFQDAEIMKNHGRRVVRFHPDIPARFGLIPRHGRADEVRWFEAEPCYILHIVNCWEEGDEIVMLGCRQPNPGGRRDPADGPLASQLAERRRIHQLHEWRFDLRTGATRERVLDDANSEFPTVNRLFVGRKSRFSYHQLLPVPGADNGIHGRCQTFDALLKYDLGNGSCQRYDYGPGRVGSETHFAPRQNSVSATAEDDGYLVSYVHDSAESVSRCLIFDAHDIEQGPVAVVRMPRRFNVGFHGMWVRGDELGA